MLERDDPAAVHLALADEAPCLCNARTGSAATTEGLHTCKACDTAIAQVHADEATEWEAQNARHYDKLRRQYVESGRCAVTVDEDDNGPFCGQDMPCETHNPEAFCAVTVNHNGQQVGCGEERPCPTHEKQATT